METHGTPDTSSSPTPHAGHAACARCGGLLLTQHYMDLLDDTGQIDITAWHCTICGEVVDSVILKNRHSPPPNLLYGTKSRKFSQRVTAASDKSNGLDSSEETTVKEDQEDPSDESNDK
ncbi:MAG: hypothetical protein K0S45_4397 [Nitrospira sp.]|nr:hypothetical protein [Nitrospira sp.]